MHAVWRVLVVVGVLACSPADEESARLDGTAGQVDAAAGRADGALGRADGTAGRADGAVGRLDAETDGAGAPRDAAAGLADAGLGALDQGERDAMPRDPEAQDARTPEALDAATSPPPTPDAAPPTVPRQAWFNHPPVDGSPDTALEEVILGLLAKAAPGSEVRAAWYTFSRRRMAAGFVEAARRGVDVRIVLGNTNVNDGCVDWAAVADLKAGLGADHVTICRPCQDGGGCQGTGINHNKFMTLSRLTDGSSNVVVQSSANLTNPQLHEHNNLVVVRDDPGLHTAYRGYWTDLSRQRQNLNYYHVEDGDHTRVYFYPRAEGDTVVGIMGNADCAAGARIRLVMAFFTDARLEVAQALASARRAGCRVTAVVRDDPPTYPGDQVLATLRGGGVDVRLFPVVGERTIHSKYLLIDGQYAGVAGRKLVWTGSHNYTGGALRSNDETLLRVDDESVFMSFDADFRGILAALEAL